MFTIELVPVVGAAIKIYEIANSPEGFTWGNVWDIGVSIVGDIAVVGKGVALLVKGCKTINFAKKAPAV